jgi:hypothetical protein
MLRLKPQIDRANTSTVCDKTELDVPVGRLPFNVGELTKVGVREVWRHDDGGRSENSTRMNTGWTDGHG